MADTLCWSCKNCTGGCSWSKKFEPVRGWEATKTFIASDKSNSYMVHMCPKYEIDKLIIGPEQISKILNIHVRSVYRLPNGEVIRRASKLGYDIGVNSEGQFILRGPVKKEYYEYLFTV